MREKEISVYIRKYIYEYCHGTEYYMKQKKNYCLCMNQLKYYTNLYLKSGRLGGGGGNISNIEQLIKFILKQNNSKSPGRILLKRRREAHLHARWRRCFYCGFKHRLN